MAGKDFSPLLIIAVGISPIIIVPILAVVVLGGDHRYWAIGGGLVLGIVLGVVAGGLLLGYNQAISGDEIATSQQERVREAAKAGSAVEIAILNMQKLDQYYALNRNQARNSFTASIVAVCVGFLAILIAARFAFANHDPKQAIPGALGGILSNFIGAAFFVMYNKSLQQLNLFYGKLVQLQDTMLAVQQCDKLSGESPDKAAEVRQTIIVALMQRPILAQSDIGAPRLVLSKARAKATGKVERTVLASTDHTDNGEKTGRQRNQ
jgi:hypothetical protein